MHNAHNDQHCGEYEVTMSSPLPIHEQTTQSASDSADVVDFLERLKAHEPQPRCILAGPDTRDHVELPPELFGILAQAAHTLLDGKNVVITQYDPFSYYARSC